MRMKSALIAAAIGVAFAGAAAGQDDPIAARKQLMKMNGAAAKAASDMVKGTTPFDATAAAAAMKTIQEDMATFITLFPDGSDQGDTKASAKIWEDRAGFEAAANKLVADAKAAEEATANGLEAFQTAFSAVGANCGGCHEAYRN